MNNSQLTNVKMNIPHKPCHSSVSSRSVINDRDNLIFTTRIRLCALQYPCPTLVKTTKKDDSLLFQELKDYEQPLYPIDFQHLSKVDQTQFPSSKAVWFLRTEDYDKFASLTLQHCLHQKARSIRYDQTETHWQRWINKRNEVMEEASRSFNVYHPGRDYFQDASPDEQEQELCYRLEDVPCPNLFPSTLVIALLKHFKATSFLDVSCGWADRLLAACALDLQYYSCDPNVEMRPAYDAILRDHGTYSNNKIAKQQVLTACFEDDVENPLNGPPRFDFMFSSPPFFDLERYCDSETQSINRYPAPKSWLRNFLLKSLWKSDRVLLPGATIVLHLSDIVCKSKKHQSVYFVQPLLEICRDVLKWEYQGTYGYTTSKDGTMKLTNGVLLAQSMFIFRKSLIL